MCSVCVDPQYQTHVKLGQHVAIWTSVESSSGSVLWILLYKCTLLNTVNLSSHTSVKWLITWCLLIFIFSPIPLPFSTSYDKQPGRYPQNCHRSSRASQSIPEQREESHGRQNQVSNGVGGVVREDEEEGSHILLLQSWTQMSLSAHLLPILHVFGWVLS